MARDTDFLELYRNLGLNPDCGLIEFKQAYRRRLAVLHPDRQTASTRTSPAELQRLTLEKLADPRGFARWFGQYNTTPKYPEIDWSPPEPLTLDEVTAMAAAGLPLCRNPASRFAFTSTDSGEVLLFVDGRCFECIGAAAQFAQDICAQDNPALPAAMEQPGDCADLLLALCNQGSVAFDEEG